MIEVTFMRREIVIPSINRFKNQPNDISLAAAAIWSVDAYASHVAFSLSPTSGDIRNIETDFKNRLIEGDYPSSLMFRVLRDTSNALKHGSRKQSHLVSNSGLVSRDVERGGWVSYFADDEHWGPQVVIDLNLQFDEHRGFWLFNNEQFGTYWPFFKQVPVLSILSPCLEIIDNALASGTSTLPA